MYTQQHTHRGTTGTWLMLGRCFLLLNGLTHTCSMNADAHTSWCFLIYILKVHFTAHGQTLTFQFWDDFHACSMFDNTTWICSSWFEWEAQNGQTVLFLFLFCDLTSRVSDFQKLETSCLPGSSPWPAPRVKRVLCVRGRFLRGKIKRATLTWTHLWLAVKVCPGPLGKGTHFLSEQFPAPAHVVFEDETRTLPDLLQP